MSIFVVIEQELGEKFEVAHCPRLAHCPRRVSIGWVNAACWRRFFFLRTYFIHGMRSFKLFSGLSLLLGTRASLLAVRQPIPHPLDVRQDSNVCSFIKVQLVGGGITVPLGPSQFPSMKSCSDRVSLAASVRMTYPVSFKDPARSSH
jgi:hypothetical protein